MLLSPGPDCINCPTINFLFVISCSPSFPPSVYYSIYQARYIIINSSQSSHDQDEFTISVPAEGVKGKTWGPSSGSNNIKARPTIVDTHNRWKAISAPSLENLPRNLVNVPSVGTVPEGISNDLSLTSQWSQLPWLQAYEEMIYLPSSPSRLSARLACKSQSIILGDWSSVWTTMAMWRAELFIFSMFRAVSVMH